MRSVPRVLITDKLDSYDVAHQRLMPSVEHRQSKYLNNRAENSHQPTRRLIHKPSVELTLDESDDSPSDDRISISSQSVNGACRA